MTDDQRIRKGESVEIACLVVGVPDPVISWYLNGERYLIYSNSRTSEGLLSTVYIHSLHSTSYIICRAANLMGVTEQSTRILVEGESCNIFRKALKVDLCVNKHPKRQVKVSYFNISNPKIPFLGLFFELASHCIFWFACNFITQCRQNIYFFFPSDQLS